MEDDGSYICDSCGEEIVIPLDPAAGRSTDLRGRLPGLLQPERDSRRVG